MRPLLRHEVFGLQETFDGLGIQAKDFAEPGAQRIPLNPPEPIAEANDVFVVKGSQIVFKNAEEAREAAEILQRAGLKSWKVRQDESGNVLLHFAQRAAAESAAVHLAAILIEKRNLQEEPETDGDEYSRFDGQVLSSDESAEVSNMFSDIVKKINDLNFFLQTVELSHFNSGDENGGEQIAIARRAMKKAYKEFALVHNQLIV